MNDEPSTLAELEQRFRDEVGVRLFTVLAWDSAARTLRRIYSSHQDDYPVGGTKTVEVSRRWLSRTVDDQEPYLGADPTAIRSVFADHALIERLDCGAVMTLPVERDDRTMVLCLLDAAGRYDEASLRTANAYRRIAADIIFDHEEEDQ